MYHFTASVLISLILWTFSTNGTNAHDNCLDCHVNSAPIVGNADLAIALPDLCIGCHPDRVGDEEHIIGIFPNLRMTQVLPLINGKIGCTTCHDIHSGLQSSLRVHTPYLCQYCHHK
jgi:predicted CXXCH cytochrome family protein